MTCELAVANRLGIALAADSAVTFSNMRGEQTYASGANKILQLGANSAIAAMIYNNAGLETMPWEVILKEYRRHLRNGGFAHVTEYRESLIEFLNENLSLLPKEMRARGGLPTYFNAAIQILRTARRAEPALGNECTDTPLLACALRGALGRIATEIDQLQVCPSLDQNDIPSQVELAHEEMAPHLMEYVQQKDTRLAEVVEWEGLIKLAVQATFTNWNEVAYGNDYTGVVIAGYGQDEFLPTCCSVRVYGYVGQRVLWADELCKSVDLHHPSSIIQPFAQRAMVETFIQGASPEVWKTVRESYLTHATAVCKAAADASGQTIPDDVIRSTVESSLEHFTRGWAQATFSAHLLPLQGVVGGLSVQELADFAETLVMLESLKEKVTSRTQSVGGPIDVAVITKAEGLVWVKRKLYFDPNLNQRYMLRLQRQYGE